MTVEVFSILMVYIAFLAFASKRMMTYMHVLQQEDYMIDRLWKWISEYSAYDKRLSGGLMVLGGVSLTGHLPEFFLNFLIFICFSIVTYKEKDPRKNAKKRLVTTTRAKRIFFPALFLAFASGTWCFFGGHTWLWILCVQLIPVGLSLVTVVLQPFEDILQKGYWNEASVKLRTLKPEVIGITGSFGKTSVKHILGHLLSHHASVLMTPGSVNTPMGVTRIIRERLDEGHKYLIVEMGAYGPGSIERLCNLTPPDYGIITAIGHAHYERFKSLDTVAETKYELAEAVIEKQGTVIAHERTLRFPHARSIKVSHPTNFIVCGDTPEIDPQKRKDTSYIGKDDYQILKVEQLPSGLKVEMTRKDRVFSFEVPLYGIHHGHNAALSVALCLELGMEMGAILKALKSLPQIQHRLEVRKNDDGTRIIDDAYNSNPLGFRAALDLMAVVQTSGRNILVTPGMVELGIAHGEIHEKIGAYAGEICDIAVVVKPDRIPTFIKSFKASGKQLVEVESFAEASQWIAKNKQDGDIILLENDLPDMYERIPNM